MSGRCPFIRSFSCPTANSPPLKTDHRLFPKVRHFLDQDARRRPSGFFSKLPPVGRISRALEFADLLPAIFFLKSRADCDAALGMATGASLRIDPGQHQALMEQVGEFVERFPFLEGHPHLSYLTGSHVAAHHAGHLPHWKLLVERLMQKGPAQGHLQHLHRGRRG